MPPAIHPKRDELSELKYHFLASLDHEIRTPLNGILGLTDLLLESDLKDEDKQHACSLRACAENLSEVIDATLQYSALAAGNVEVAESEFQIDLLLKSALARYQSLAGDKGLPLSLSLDLSLPETAYGDALRISQIIHILVSNAVKFTNKGEICLHARPSFLPGEDSFRLVVEVKDTGIGIGPEHQREIFEAFHQLESGLSRRYSGLGLGLASALKVSQLLGAALSLESLPGVGSTFRLEVPVRVVTQSSLLPLALSVNTTSGTSADHARPSVLVVEDNEVAQRIVTKTLSKRNYRVVSAYNGIEAIHRFEESAFDLILMDLQMPRMDGIEATSRIRESQAGRNVPIVAFTANVTAEYRQMCRDAGFSGFLAKPINTAELLATVEGFCRSCVKKES